MATDCEWAWFAGVFEGEGNISTHYKGNSVSIQVRMSDRDIIERLHRIAGCGWFRGPVNPGPGRKPQWGWGAGHRDDVLSVLDRIEPYLGERRSEAAASARLRLAKVRSYPKAQCQKRPRGPRTRGKRLLESIPPTGDESSTSRMVVDLRKG